MSDIENFNVHYDNNELNLFLDISTFCNAGCPQCHRTDIKGLGKVDWLPLIQWSLEEFKTAFPLETISHVDRLEFCGTWGDPMMNKDIFKIVEYVINESNARILINTNGSIRNSDWWWDFGLMGGDRVTVVWALDGCTQEMHSLYRQNTDLNIVLDNMEVFTAAGGLSEIFTVVFKHSQAHLYDIAILGKNHGATLATFVQSNRFKPGQSKFTFTDGKGSELFLEKSNVEDTSGFYWSGYNLNNDEDMQRIKDESLKGK